MTVILFVLAGILALFAGVDVLGHLRLQLRRTVGGWLLTAALMGGCVCSAALGTVQALQRDDAAKEDLYLAFRYLEDGEGEAARVKAAQCPGEDGALITLLADAVDRDYFDAYFSARQLTEKGDLSREGADTVRELLYLAASALGLAVDETTGQVQTVTGEALPLVGLAEEETAPQVITEEERHTRILELVRQMVLRQNISVAQASRLDEMYDVELALATGRVDSLSEEEINSLLAQYPDDDGVQLLGVRYYAQRGEYTAARRLALQRLEDEASAANYVIYTDLIAQQALDRDYAATETGEDPQADELLRRAQRLEEQAAALDAGGSYNQDKYQQMIKQAQDLRDQAQRLDIERAINYLQAKKPLFGDRTGMLDLQLAKLYVAADDRDTARQYVWRVMEKAGALQEDSPLAQPMEEVAAAWNRMDGEQDSAELSRAVRTAVQAQSQGVVPLEEGSVNGTVAEYMTSTLKYDKLQLFISRIDTAAYPTVKAYVNISGEKDSVFGLASEFKAGDFEVHDTQYPIKDFKLLTEGGDKMVNIALVLDLSGSMDGHPLENAKLAARSCAENMDPESQRMSVVGYEDGGGVVVSLTDSADTLINGIEGMASGGGTNIPAGIRTGVGSLAGTAGTRAMILLTDGQDQYSDDMPAALQEAARAGVVIYTVGLGSVDSAYLRHIADSTGGKYISAANATELSDIYRMLQKYIVNNYCFEYTVTANPERDPRRLTIQMPQENVYGERAYTILGGTADENDAETEARLLLEDELVLFAITPAGVSKSDLKKGISISFAGRGFGEGVSISIGGIPVSNLKVKSDTEAAGTIKGDLEPGIYDVRVTDSAGRVEVLFGSMRVFKAGTVSSVQIGNMFVLADVIGATKEDASGEITQLSAIGNVSINGFLHSSGELLITPDASLRSEALDAASKDKALYLGATGDIEGSGKLYVSYEQTRQTAGDGLIGDYFTERLLGGKDLVVRSGSFTVEVGPKESGFGNRQDQPMIDQMRDYSIDIPGMTKMFATTVNLYADRLQLDSDLLNIGDIEDNLISGLTGGAWGSQKDKDALEDKWGKWGEIKGNGRQGKAGIKTYELDGKLSVAVGADAVRVGGEVELELEATKKFVLFPIKGLSVKINSLDADNSFWAFGVKFQPPGLSANSDRGKNNDITIDATLSSYLWYPDALDIDVEKADGFVTLYKVLKLTKLGGGFTGLSRVWTDENTAAGQQDIAIKVRTEAVLNVFGMLDMPTTGAMRSVSRWGEMGKISNAEAVVNITDLSITLSADLELLQQKIAAAQLYLDTQQIAVEGSMGADISAAGIHLDAHLTDKIKVQWLGNTDGGVTAYKKLGGDGRIAVDWAGLDERGQVGLDLSADIGTDNGTIISIMAYGGDKWIRAWYDSNGQHLLDKFHISAEL